MASTISVKIPVEKVEAAIQKSTVCWVCHAILGEEGSAALLSTGCGCRGGTSTAHIECLTEAAKHNRKSWTHCPTCGQRWTGEMDLGLAEARWESVQALPEDDEYRLCVASNLAVAREEWRHDQDHADVLTLLEHILAVSRNKFGNSDEYTLHAMQNLGVFLTNHKILILAIIF